MQVGGGGYSSSTLVWPVLGGETFLVSFMLASTIFCGASKAWFAAHSFFPSSFGRPVKVAP